MTPPVTHLSMRAAAGLSGRAPDSLPINAKACDGTQSGRWAGLICYADRDDALPTCPECAVIADEARSRSALLEVA